jgi:hypothetical protein
MMFNGNKSITSGDRYPLTGIMRIGQNFLSTFLGKFRYHQFSKIFSNFPGSAFLQDQADQGTPACLLRRHFAGSFHHAGKKTKNLHSFARFPVPMPSKFFEVNARLMSSSAHTLGTDYVTQTISPHTQCLPHPYRSHRIGMHEHSWNDSTCIV